MESFIRSKYESRRWVLSPTLPDPSTFDASSMGTSVGTSVGTTVGTSVATSTSTQVSIPL